jgi:hypothetical protein
MFDNLHRSWCLHYATEISLSLLACFALAAFAPAKRELQTRHLLICAAAWLCTIAAILLFCLAIGMSISGLYEGVVRLPLHLSKSFIVAVRKELFPITTAATGLVLAILAAWKLKRSPALLSTPLLCLAGVLRITVAIATLYFLSKADRTAILALAPAFVWLLLFPVRHPRSDDSHFARAFLAFLAIFQTLWAYPVAGSQMAFATFLAVLAMVVTLADGIAVIAAAIPAAKIAFAWQIAAAAAILLVAFFDMQQFAASNRQTYDQNIPLDLPGSHWMRLPGAPGSAYQLQPLIAANLRRNADIFYTAPGLCSYYFWTQTQPPTPANATGWMYILNDRQQQQIIDVLEQHSRAVYMIAPRLVDFWMQNKPMPQVPLVQYFKEHFRRAYELYGVQFWVRKDRSSVDIVNADGSVSRLDLPPAN